MRTRPTWEHPLACGHTVTLDHPKPSRRISYYCYTCQKLRRLGAGEAIYHPATGPDGGAA